MKRIIKFLSVILALAIIIQSPISVLAAVKNKYTNTTYTHQSRFDGYDIINGIDVSQHNDDVDFNKVKADGIEYVFVRVGYTGYTKSKFSLNYDKKYKTYIKDALAAGLRVGVYWYSQALTTKEAVSEAGKLLSAIEGYGITMPVVYDYEFAGTSAGRLDSAKLSRAKMTANALAFLDTVSAAGYDACLYASENFLKEKLYASQISSLYKVWLANYSSKTAYTGDYEFWQYTSKGKVNGISGSVDMNFWYYDNNLINLADEVYTGAPITPEPLVIYGDTVLVKGIDYDLIYTNNLYVGTGIIEAVGKNAYQGYYAKYRFKIVPQSVEGLTYLSATKESLTYSWTPAVGATAYKVYGVNNTKGNSFSKTVYANYAVLEHLTQDNSYTIKVSAGIPTADGNIMWGAYSDPVTSTTAGGSITGLKVKSKSDTAIRVSWNKKYGVDGYAIYQYNEKRKHYDRVGTASANATSYKITGLKPGKAYKFRVGPIKSGIVGEKIYVKGLTRPSKVSIKSVKNSSKRKATVYFKTNGAAGYQIQWSTKKNFSSDRKTVTFGRTSKKTIKTAKSKKRYYFRVRAYTKLGSEKIYGSWSSTKSVYIK